jgi:cell division protein ZapA
MSDSDSKTLSISIMQKEFQVACPADEEEALLRSAKYLHEQMEGIRSSGKVVGMDRIAVMAALNMANELLSGESKIQTSQDYAKLRIRTLNDRIETAIADGKQLKL